MKAQPATPGHQRHSSSNCNTVDRSSHGAVRMMVPFEGTVLRADRGGQLEVHVRIANTYTVCCPLGALDESTAPHLRQAMALMSSVPHLIVDLSKVPFIDSAALGALVNGIRRVREHGGEVAVCSTGRHITHVLHTIGFDRLVPLAGSVEEARRTLCGVPAALSDVA